MVSPQNIDLSKNRSFEVEELLNRAEQQFPGISELLKVYGGYEEMVRSVEQYLEATRPEPFVTTSNRSYSET